MSTTSVVLPVTAGAVGAAADVSALSGKKTFVFSDITGVIRVEARIGSGSWCEVLSATVNQNDHVFTIVADEMRIDATNGGAGSAEVAAERSAIRTVTLPAPAGANQGGDPVDISALGSLHTAYASGVGATAAAELQISQDGVHFSQVLSSFTTPDCYETGCFDANYARVFARGGSVGAMELGAEESAAGAALSEPRRVLVFRPEATGDDAPGGNVYTVWEELYEAIEALRPFGTMILEFDAKFSSVSTPSGPACVIPARPDLDNPGQFLRWDMRNVIWSDVLRDEAFLSGEVPNIPPTITFDDDCEIVNLETIHANTVMFLYHDGTVNTPIIGGTFFTGGRIDCYNTDPTALPMFKADATADFFVVVGYAVSGRLGTTDPGNPGGGIVADSPAPLFGGEDKFCVHFLVSGAIANNIWQLDAGGFMIWAEDANGPQGPHEYDMPNVDPAATWVCSATFGHGGQWRIMAYADEPGTGFSTGTLQTAALTAGYNDQVPLDSSGGAFAVTLPPANPALQEPITLKDVAGACGANPITVVASGTDVVESPFLATNFGSKTWYCDGIGNWRLMDCCLDIDVKATPESANFTPDYDAAYEVDTAAVIATLPSAAIKDRVVSLHNSSAGAIAVAAGGGDSLVGDAAPAAGATVAYRSDGGTRWVQVAA